MIRFTNGLDKFLAKYYPKEFVLIAFGHSEHLTDEMYEEYQEWLKCNNLGVEKVNNKIS